MASTSRRPAAPLALGAVVSCPNCGGATRAGGLDYDLCKRCGPVRYILNNLDLSDLPADWATMDVDQLLEALGPDAFDRLIGRMQR